MKSLLDKPFKKAVFVFGKFNPPTVGHSLIFDELISISEYEECDMFIITSKKQDNIDNILSPQEKIRYITLAYPKFQDKILIEDDVFSSIRRLSDMGYGNLTMLCGSDRIKEYKKKILKYVNHPDDNKNLGVNITFKKIGNRDNLRSIIQGCSSTKVRSLAKKGEFEKFLRRCPPTLHKNYCQEIYEKFKTKTDSFSLTHSDLSIDRIDLPQIKDIDDFISWALLNRITLEFIDKDIRDLKPTQKLVDQNKINKKYIESLSKTSSKLIIVSNDNYILDGHHTYFVNRLNSVDMVSCLIVDLPINDLINKCKLYPNVIYSN